MDRFLDYIIDMYPADDQLWHSRGTVIKELEAVCGALENCTDSFKRSVQVAVALQDISWTGGFGSIDKSASVAGQLLYEAGWDGYSVGRIVGAIKTGKDVVSYPDGGELLSVTAEILRDLVWLPFRRTDTALSWYRKTDREYWLYGMRSPEARASAIKADIEALSGCLDAVSARGATPFRQISGLVRDVTDNDVYCALGEVRTRLDLVIDGIEYVASGVESDDSDKDDSGEDDDKPSETA